MKKAGKVKIWFVEYQEGRARKWWPESLTGDVAMRLGKELAIRGCKPMVRRMDVPTAELHNLMVRFEFIPTEGLARSL